jgi:peptidoglycan LD-endopeptidase LytH
VSLSATARARIWILVIAGVTVSSLSLFLWTRIRQSQSRSNRSVPNLTATQHLSPTPATSPAASIASTTPTPSATESPVVLPVEPGFAPTASPAAANQPSPSSFIGTVKLIIPVAGVKPEQLLDTFTDARSEGRSHDAIDISAPAGAPVLAASDGEIVRLFQSDKGGTTIYQLSPDKKLIFYYAHLQRYADGLYAGKFVRQGDVLAYVGDTGNAGAGNYHLHFSIAVIADPKRYWEGTNINPYPLLRQ